MLGHRYDGVVTETGLQLTGLTRATNRRGRDRNVFTAWYIIL